MRSGADDALRPVRRLDPTGRRLEGAVGLSAAAVREAYRRMVELRVFDRRAVSLQRQGRIGTYAPMSGQEAAQVGAVLAIDRQDWIFPTYRDHAAMYLHGMPLARLLLYPMGHPLGGVPPEGVPIYPISISIASHLPHAVGMAQAQRRLNTGRICLAFHGDGATSEGDFHEALNFAGVWSAPVVFLCQNNGWAISLPRERQTRSGTLAEKALAYGLAAALVDGNDLLAVHQVVGEAAARARRGEGATLVECLTYRLGAHTTADDPSRYRSAEELQRHEAEDPLVRTRRFLEAQGLWDEELERQAWTQAREAVAEAVRQAEAEPPPSPDFFFDLAYATPTPPLERQRALFWAEEERPTWPS